MHNDVKRKDPNQLLSIQLPSQYDEQQLNTFINKTTVAGLPATCFLCF